MKNKVLITTNHPGNYMDILFQGISQYFDLTVLYNKEKSSEKLWKEQNFYPSDIIKNLSLQKISQILNNQDFIIIGGWHGRTNMLIILYLILRRRNFSVFSDVPDDKNITVTKIFFKKIFFSFIPYIFVTGKSGKEHFQKFYNIKDNKIKIFPYAILLPNKEKILENIEKRNNILMNKTEEKIRIFIANRFIKRKGYDVILNSFKQMKEEGILENFSIKIAGSGEEYREYEKKFNNLDDSIEILKWIEVDEYNKLIQNMDIFIHASSFEPYGIPILDSMAHGKLTIASNGVMSAVDYIEDTKNGYIFKKKKSEELTQILKHVNLNRKLIYSIGKLGLKTSTSFTTKKHVSSILYVMKESS